MYVAVLTQSDLVELAEAAEGHVCTHDMSTHPLRSHDDAMRMLRDAQAASRAYWAKSTAIVPVQETFVLCGDASGASWPLLMEETAQR